MKSIEPKFCFLCGSPIKPKWETDEFGQEYIVAYQCKRGHKFSPLVFNLVIDELEERVCTPHSYDVLPE